MKRNELLPEMSIEITVGEFHDTHDAAIKAKDLLKTDISKLSLSNLKKALEKFEAGQELTDAETGPDFMYAPDYRAEIKLIEKEIEKRKKRKV